MNTKILSLFFIVLTNIGCSSGPQYLSPTNRSNVNFCFNKTVDQVSKIGITGSLSRLEKSSKALDSYTRMGDSISTHFREFAFLSSPKCAVAAFNVDLKPQNEYQIKYNVLFYVKEQQFVRVLKGSDISGVFKKMSLDEIYSQSLNLLGEKHETTKSIKLIKEFFSRGFVHK